MHRNRAPRTCLTIALVVALSPGLAHATLIDLEPVAVTETLTPDLRSGSIREEDVASITVSASGFSATVLLGESVTLAQDIRVTIDGLFASPFSLHETFIEPQIFDSLPSLDPGIESDFFGLYQLVTLDGTALFETPATGRMLTVRQPDLQFERTVEMYPEGLDLAPGGWAEDYVVDATVTDQQLSGSTTFTFGDKVRRRCISRRHAPSA